jgi:ABC-type sugar transport system substrate-binding protein
MKRIVLLLAMAAIAALMLAATAFPAAAAAPEAGCPPGFVEKEQNLPDSSVGVPSTEVNTTKEDCFKKLENAPQQLKDRFGTDEVGMDDVVRERRER